MAWNNKIPFDGKIMMEYVHPLYDYIDDTYMPREPEWRDNIVFEAQLTYTSYSTGRSAIRFHFIDEATNILYSMGIAAFDDIVKNLNNGRVFGKWKFAKQGQNYGLVPVEY